MIFQHMGASQADFLDTRAEFSKTDQADINIMVLMCGRSRILQKKIWQLYHQMRESSEEKQA